MKDDKFSPHLFCFVYFIYTCIIASALNADHLSHTQITGCLNSSAYPFAANDAGGQFDVRSTDGA